MTLKDDPRTVDWADLSGDPMNAAVYFCASVSGKPASS